MGPISIRRVISKKDLRKFLTFPWKIYKNDPIWVPPILSDRIKHVNPKRGVFYQRGTAEFFSAYRDGEMVGTICAAVDFKANEAVDKCECVFGFFECVNDEQVAFALFDRVVEWAVDRGLNSVLGPFNLDYEDGYGILIEGRDRPPVLLCGHTTDYYQKFVEEYGFLPARGDNLAFARDLKSGLKRLEQTYAFADRVHKRKNFIIRRADFSSWQEEVDVVFELINPSLAHLPGHVPWRREALHELMAPFVTMADPDLILFAEVDGKPIGFFPALPNYNEALIHANGLRYPWDYFNAWRYSRMSPKSATIKSVLVLPEYWGSGVAILLFSEMVKALLTKGYDWVDMSLTSADNPRTPALAERIGAKIYKRYRVYRKVF
jgi:GNAT superfamily N-acetyltransferase